MRELTLTEFRAYLNKGIPTDAVDKALNRAGLIVENEAKMLCPIDTGQLRNSITHRLQNNGTERACIVGTNVEYAPYVEFGTGIHAVNGDGRQTPWVYRTADGQYYWTEGQEAQPYLEPALEHKANEVKAEILRIIKGELFK